MVILIEQKDIKKEFYRSSGPGGQHKNTTDSSVRLTYIPLKIVSTACDERSQHKNLKLAYERLIEKIKKHYIGIQKDRNQKLYGEMEEVNFGGKNRRTYYLVGNQKTVDHNTNEELSTREVLTGDIDIFIRGNLLKEIKELDRK